VPADENWQAVALLPLSGTPCERVAIKPSGASLFPAPCPPRLRPAVRKGKVQEGKEARKGSTRKSATQPLLPRALAMFTDQRIWATTLTTGTK